MNIRDITDHHQYPGWLMQRPRWIYLHYFFLWFFFLRSRICRRAIKGLLKNLEDRNNFILDAGCGEGQYLIPFATRFPGLHFTGIDILPDHIDFLNNLAAKEGLQNCTFSVEDLESHLPDSRPYSLIYIIGVLQYVSDPAGVIELAHRSQTDGGQLMVYTPLDAGIEFGFYRYIRNKYGHYDDARSRYKAIHRSDLDDWIHQAGYRIVTERPHYGYLASLGHQMMQSLMMLITAWKGILKVIPVLFFIILMPIFVPLQIFETWIRPTARNRYNGLLLILQK